MRRKPRINRFDGSAKKSKIFRRNPKVLQKAAVTGLDVAKKSRFAALFFDSKGMYFGTCIPQETFAAQAYKLICECL
ncbi:hypothetical protein GTP44_05810 [Duganella sp. FT50W]|uniref:Uncharacterized protein n=1 Tax=Duganella lactea TaxID=2692173 RepID=A0A6L8MPH2_9BURK|nr:hypothetical protein [Duganella lactea]MYM81468.1 hypothetical protein [Duganella lactea]